MPHSVPYVARPEEKNRNTKPNAGSTQLSNLAIDQGAARSFVFIGRGLRSDAPKHTRLTTAKNIVRTIRSRRAAVAPCANGMAIAPRGEDVSEHG
jgi:hypothetical protein